MKNQLSYTIKDIAKDLGLSHSTVSRALNDHPNISQQTKDKVREVVEKFGYRHNALAASLRSSKSKIIGLLVPKIAAYFQSTVITAIQNTLHEYGYNLMVCQSNESLELEKELVNDLYGSRVAGLIVSTTLYTTDFSHFEIFTRSGIPIVFYDRVPKDHPAHKVLGNDYEGGYLVTKHLLQQGSRRIAHISGPLTCNIYKDRYAGYQDALAEFNVPLNEQYVYFKELSCENALDACRILFSLPEVPDAVFAGNDTTAIGVLDYAKKNGIKIPSELKVVGYSNDPRAEIIEPAITSVEQFPYEMGKQAANLMMNLIMGEATSANNLISLTTPIDLVKRKSSAVEF